ncbi:MAG: Tol-Pal system protein TolB [endosymbiont of Galathealinum brachiosum]|uniref:Tol-Pal system protein TolB n=1 Tax=endosymbiont of Galathealinum brachiosum TaxID=2200906 RepID=A0A370DJ31_9GAMM|nr:MAG: Tol-Pal system protein TolB [endosymbiont of Galathealinum brachiosum]
MKKNLTKVILIALFFIMQTANATLQVEITKGSDNALPIAVVPFELVGPAASLISVSDLVASDLKRSGKFKPIDKNKLISTPKDLEEVNYKLWRVAGIDHLVIGKLNVIKPNQYEVSFRLIDVFKGVQVLGYQFSANDHSLRGISHHISDLIYEKITGQKGAFDTKIAYVTVERKQGVQPSYKLQVADTDGYNSQTVLNSTQPVMSPSWSPDGSKLAYVSFEKRKSEIYVQNLFSQQREKVATFKGINGAPVWSPDGKQLALTLSKSGNPDIYVLTVATKKLKQITKHWGIDTEPTWTPDGNEIVFTSSRSGKPQIYRVSVKGGSAKRLTFEGKYNASPEVSSDGRTLVFVQGEGNTFKISTMDMQSGFVQVLTEGPLDESPSFAPNGSMILYASTDKFKGVLAAVSTDGRFKQKLILSEGDVREPSWGPFRK